MKNKIANGTKNHNIEEYAAPPHHELKLSKAALRESEERMRMISDNIPGGATYQIVTQPDGTSRYTYISAGVEHLFDVRVENVLADAASLRRLIIDGDLARVTAQEQEALRDGKPFDCEFRCRMKAGDIKWVHCRSTAIRQDDGSVLWSGVVVDITARKRAQAEVRSQKIRLEMALEVAGMVTWEWDIPTGSIKYFHDLSTLVRGEDVGRYCTVESLLNEIHPEDRERLSQALERAIQQSSPWECEYRARMLDGTYRWILGKGRIVVAENEKPVRMLGVSTDITERKRAEECQRHQQKLESIGRLAGGVAHEINNPLAGIMGFAQLIATKVDSKSPLKEHASEIIRLTERTASIVENLLTFARHETQTHSPADIRDIIESTLVLILTVLPRDQIAVEMDISDHLPMVNCRSQQIQQVLMNLLTNARDALNEKYPEGSPDKIIRVTAEALEKDGEPWVRMTVEDHGTGIAPTIQDKIFDPFFTTKELGKGSGLGLSTSHSIVEEHRGDLHFESEPGHWTKFHLDLPVGS